MRDHIPALDGLRGCAILLVLAHNFDLLEPYDLPSRMLDYLPNMGWVGVQLFFVLSGFLITGNLLDSRTERNYWGNFFIRRSLRIFPIYYATLIVTFLLAPLFTSPVAGHEHQIWLWTYLVNWSEPSGKLVPLFPHFWSLAIEEQFYILWPLTVLLFAVRPLYKLCICLCVAAIASRTFLVHYAHNVAGAYMYTTSRMDALAIGAMAAIAIRDPSAARRLVACKPWLARLGLALLIVTAMVTRGAPRTGDRTQIFGYTLIALAFAAILLHVVINKMQLARVMSLAPLRTVGRYSYAMYVFHMPLHLLVGLPYLERHGLLPLSVGTSLLYESIASLATFGLGWLSYYLLERRFLALKTRLAPSNRRAVLSA